MRLDGKGGSEGGPYVVSDLRLPQLNVLGRDCLYRPGRVDDACARRPRADVDADVVVLQQSAWPRQQELSAQAGWLTSEVVGLHQWLAHSSSPAKRAART